MSEEVEWQFDAPDLETAVEWLEGAAVPGYRVVQGSTKEFVDSYFDTPEWRIHRAGFTARIRAAGGRARLTLKSMAAARDGLRSRQEYEEDVTSTSLSETKLAEGPCGERLRALVGTASLVSLFSVATNRRLFQLLDESGSVAEIAVDRTRFPGRDPQAAAMPMQRIEVELQPGCAPDRAQRFIDVLVAAGALVPGRRSKFEAGLESAGLSGPARFDYGATTVARDQTAAETAFAILRRQFALFRENEPGTRLGEDIEALHDMRVAVRRMRAAMAAFRPYLTPSVLRYGPTLRWVAAALGEVRDLDVHLEEFEAYHSVLELELVEGMKELEEVLRVDREQARRRLLRTLDSRRYDAFLVAFGALLQNGPPESHSAGSVPILVAAPRLLRRRYRGVRRLGDAITKTSPPTDYHIVRIAAKKLRYGLEFLGPLYGPPATQLSGRVTALQDVLGRHQDLDVVSEKLLSMTTRRGARLSSHALMAIGAVRERNRQEAAVLRSQFRDAYRPLKGKLWTRVQGACAEAAGKAALRQAMGRRGFA